MQSFSRGSLLKIKLLFLCPLLMIGMFSFSQNKNIATAQQSDKWFTNLTYLKGDNENTGDNNPIQHVDSIAHATTIASAFCQVYCNVMQNTVLQIQCIDSGANAFIKKFENGFADYFLRAWIDYKNKILSPESEWKCFFSNPNAQPWQLVLLGVNAHTNIDIWQTLVNNFSEQEVRQYKKPMLAMQSSVAKVYYQFFNNLMPQSPYLRFINTVTLGLAKKIGERLVYKWRRRNVKLATMYYQNPERFKRKLAIVYRKKQRTDQRILHYKS